ncbi:bifunctional lysylphosphatidylglycerol flippase/synthetase MprF [Pikeienuella sp. HZG-20]|uniref:bifunctional lysylphosphatidylglycerol flippase/synthetase MprF n=1 Tax=Paludibacillus litoralis TaxID=3133267 RepID=UPI0030EE4755
MSDAPMDPEAPFWSRLRPAAPYIVTAALFVLGAFALYHLLRPVDLDQVMAQVRGTPRRIIALSLLATFTGYAALIGYDWSALRYLGKTLPLPTIMTGGFLGYALGNTIGAGPLTGGAVRYRIYSALGLTGYDIAAIAIFGSVAFGLGAAVIGFGALAYHPEALKSLTSLSPPMVRGIAIGALLASLGLVGALALRRSEIRIRGHRFKTPSSGLILGQFIFTAIEIVMAATVLYLLLPASALGFATFLAVFAAAILAGVASHVPGGVGVFETIIIAALPASVPVEQAAAGLLLYRLIYYLAPFSLALVLLALSELRMASGRIHSSRLQALAPVFGAVSAIAPLAMSAMVFGSGVVMLLSSLIPPTSEFADDLELLLPLGFVEGGALLSSAIGVALLVIAHGMLRRAEGAYWLAMLALASGIAASLMQGLDYDRAAALFVMLLVLTPCRREFFRSTRLTRNPLSFRWLLLVSAVAVTALAVFFFAHKATPFSNDLWWRFAANEAAPRALRAGLLGSIVIATLTLVMAMRPPRIRASLPSRGDVKRAGRIAAAQASPDANFVLTGDKSILFSDNGRAFLMYRAQGRSWIALGDPVGDPDEAAHLAWKFHDAANAAGARAIFYEATATYLSLWAEMGFAIHKMGEEAVVHLGAFSLEGGERKKLRAAYSRAGRDGLSFEILPAPVDDATLAAMRAISDQWLAGKKRKEKQFSVGRFDEAYLREFPIAIVRHDGRMVAFANILTTELKEMASIDLMRHVDDAPSGLMEYLFIALMLRLKADGYAALSLGMAPLAGLETRRGSRWTMKLGALVYRHGGHFYNFEGLRAFKSKFNPEWRARFLVAPPRANILVIAADAAALVSGGARRRI